MAMPNGWRHYGTEYDRRVIPLAPESRAVMSADGLHIATYDFGEGAGLADDAPVVLAVHGFASSAIANWQATGWVRS